MKNLYKFSLKYGRHGNVEGLFIADDELMRERVYGHTIWFGEILGKHSEVWADFEEKDFTISDNQAVISTLIELFPSKETDGDCDPIDTVTISGYNPLHYTSEYDE